MAQSDASLHLVTLAAWHGDTAPRTAGSVGGCPCLSEFRGPSGHPGCNQQHGIQEKAAGRLLLAWSAGSRLICNIQCCASSNCNRPLLCLWNCHQKFSNNTKILVSEVWSYFGCHFIILKCFPQERHEFQTLAKLYNTGSMRVEDPLPTRHWGQKTPT